MKPFLAVISKRYKKYLKIEDIKSTSKLKI